MKIIRLAFAVAVLTAACLCLLSAAYASTYGSCGETTTWSLDNGVLTIAGTGEMNNYQTEEQVPWFSQRDAIQSVVIQQGVASVGSRAFIVCI